VPFSDKGPACVREERPVGRGFRKRKTRKQKGEDLEKNNKGVRGGLEEKSEEGGLPQVNLRWLREKFD